MLYLNGQLGKQADDNGTNTMTMNQTTERTMSDEEKAKRSDARKKNFKPVRLARRFLLEAMASAIQRGHNKMSTTQFNLVVQEAVQMQIKAGEGQRGTVERKKKDGTVYTVENAPLTYKGTLLYDLADMQRAFTQGKVNYFLDEDGNLLNEEDAAAAAADEEAEAA